jgi:heptosyltransferase-2
MKLAIRVPNWLGDAVMALPAMAAVRAAFPEAHISMVAPRSVAPMFEEQTAVAPDAIAVVDGATEAAEIQGRHFDTTLLLTNSFRTAWVARRARVPERWGYRANFRAPLLTRAVERPLERVHQTAYYRELVRGLGLDAPDILPHVAIRAETAARAEDLLARFGRSGPVVGFAPGAAYGHAKRWLPARVADVITRLTTMRAATCVLVGAAGDRDAAREIESSLPRGISVVDLIGRTDLRLLAGVLAACDAFVSNDSGAMHLAAAVGVPVTAIFGPTDDRVTAPRGDHDVMIHQVFCRPCMLRDCPIDHRCMKGITADAVFAAVSRRLDTGMATESSENR